MWDTGRRQGHGELIHANHKYVGVFKEDRVSCSCKVNRNMSMISNHFAKGNDFWKFSRILMEVLVQILLHAPFNGLSLSIHSSNIN